MAVNDFEGAIVVVTGASTGLGRAVAVEVASRGAKAVIINYARSEDEAHETAGLVREHGAEARKEDRMMAHGKPMGTVERETAQVDAHTRHRTAARWRSGQRGAPKTRLVRSTGGTVTRDSTGLPRGRPLARLRDNA